MPRAARAVEPQRQGETLDRAKREIPLAALHAAHAGTVHAEHVRERFLAQAALFSAPAQVAPESPLQVTLHPFELSGMLRPVWSLAFVMSRP